MQKNNTLEDFYYQIRHLRDEKKEIENIAFQNRNKFMEITDTLEGLCKICTSHISADLDKAGIEYQKINLQEEFGIFDHECILARYKNKEYHYVLIDISFPQFLPKEGKINTHLREYPALLLSQTEEGKQVAESLTNIGFSEITDETWKQYINSFALKENVQKAKLTDFFTRNKRK